MASFLLEAIEGFFWLRADVLDVPTLFFFLPLEAFLLAFEGVASWYPVSCPVSLLDLLDDSGGSVSALLQMLLCPLPESSVPPSMPAVFSFEARHTS